MPKIKETTERVICPGCKGMKQAAYLVFDGDYEGYEWRTCELCGGVGMVLKIKRVEYKPIENAS